MSVVFQTLNAYAIIAFLSAARIFNRQKSSTPLQNHLQRRRISKQLQKNQNGHSQQQDTPCPIQTSLQYLSRIFTKPFKAVHCIGKKLDQLDKSYTCGFTLPIFWACFKAVLYGLVINVAIMTRIRDFASFWPPNGIAVGFCLTASKRQLYFLIPALLVTLFFVNTFRNTVVASVFFTLINFIESAICFLFIRHFARPLTLCRRRNAIAIVLGCFIAAFVGGLLGAAFVVQYYKQPWDVYRIQAFRWFTADGLGE
jgi:hypothetical protein